MSETGSKVMGTIVSTVISEAFQRAQKLRAVPSNYKQRTQALAKEITKNELVSHLGSGISQADLARLYNVTTDQMRAVLVHHKLIEP